MEQYTLIGHPLGHSMSPFIHERLFALAGREASYTLTDLAPEQLPPVRCGSCKALTSPFRTKWQSCRCWMHWMKVLHATNP